MNARGLLLAGLLAVIVASFYAVRLMRAPTTPAPPSPPPELAPRIVERPDPVVLPPPPPDAPFSRDFVVAAYDEAHGLAKRRAWDVRACLDRYAAAEDYVREAIEHARTAGRQADEAEFSAIYQSLLDETDAYVAGPDAQRRLEGLPWRDLLADPAEWSATRDLPGFTFAIQGGVLSVTGPDAATKRDGVAGVLDEPGGDLRAFLLEMDFQIDGCADMHIHVEPRPRAPSRAATDWIELSTRDTGLTKGRPRTLTVRALKQRCEWVVEDWGGAQCGVWSAPPLLRRRSGGIAFRVTPGTQLKITRMRIKQLR
jgi:hypothetical protein